MKKLQSSHALNFQKRKKNIPAQTAVISKCHSEKKKWKKEKELWKTKKFTPEDASEKNFIISSTTAIGSSPPEDEMKYTLTRVIFCLLESPYGYEINKSTIVNKQS